MNLKQCILTREENGNTVKTVAWLDAAKISTNCKVKIKGSEEWWTVVKIGCHILSKECVDDKGREYKDKSEAYV